MDTTLATIQRQAQQNNFKEAEKALERFIGELFSLQVDRVEIRRDTLSLNSVNGVVYLAVPDVKVGSDVLFFKFHHEENEEGLTEYYNSKLLAENGFPVETPVYASQEVGKQILLYPLKQSRRLFDVCKECDATMDDQEVMSVIQAQEQLDMLVCDRYLSTLHLAPIQTLAEEPILQLFTRRLTDDPLGMERSLGGRYVQFYEGKSFIFPEIGEIDFGRIAALEWRINGRVYPISLLQAFQRSLRILSLEAHKLPEKESYAAVIAHGDAHNGNVWYNEAGHPFLSLFDPAFAGKHIPALLAEIKPTFHNIFAHPLWLYNAEEMDSMLDISCAVKDGYIDVQHNWSLSPLREAFLASKKNKLWKPLLKEMKAKQVLQENWQEYMRAALFCCPTLVMNLRANAGNARNSHTPKTSLLGMAISIMLFASPKEGDDIISMFFADMENAIS